MQGKIRKRASLRLEGDAAQVMQAVAELDSLTAHVPACCQIAAAHPGSVEKLLQVVQTCFRSTANRRTLQHAFAVLAHFARHRASAASLLADRNSLPLLAGQLQGLRENEVPSLAPVRPSARKRHGPGSSHTGCRAQELFMAVAEVLRNLVRRPELTAGMISDRASIKQIAAVSQILSRKVDNERKYLARLEGRLPPNVHSTGH